MPRNQHFVELLQKMIDIHEKKNADYASGSFFENFERSAELASWFMDAVDKSFVTLIGTKLARLSTLLNKVGAPNNESIDDSFLDLTVYCGLWASYHKELDDRKMKEQAGRQALGMQNQTPAPLGGLGWPIK